MHGVMVMEVVGHKSFGSSKIDLTIDLLHFQVNLSISISVGQDSRLVIELVDCNLQSHLKMFVTQTTMGYTR